MKIPMVDLKTQYLAIRPEIDAALADVLESTHFILGPNGQAFEREVAEYCNVRHAIGVSSGTDALHLALRGAGIGPGDEVITPAFTFIATAEAISYVGAEPVFADIDPRTFNIDIASMESLLSDRTRAVMPVHLFGQPAQLEPIRAFCKAHELLLIEDCAQAFGAEVAGKKAGSIGDAGCFSFFPSKNLGCYGDGGMIITDDDHLANEIRVLRNHGSRERYHHSIIGYNSRLDDMQAAILRVKLKHIDDYNRKRYENAQRYSAQLSDCDVITPYEDGVGRHVYHQYTLLSDRRDVIHRALTEAGIASAIYYPIPLHRQEVYAERFREISLPVAEETAGRVLSLPMYPELTEEDIDLVCSTIRKALA